jgi:hypothetical protein
MDSGVTCTGSPTPSTLSLSNLFAAGTAEQTTRVTEGFPASFQPKDPTSDTGTRFLLSYSNVPAGAAIYVPDAVAGSGATVPTAGGDLGTPAAVGQYTPASHTLLLVRVLNADHRHGRHAGPASRSQRRRSAGVERSQSRAPHQWRGLRRI